jgi:hypothetical protein
VDLTDIPAPSTDCPYPSPSKQAVRDAAVNWARMAGTNVTTYVCYGDVALSAVQACDANGTDTGDNGRGQKVTVLVTANVGLAAPSFFGFGSISLSANATMLINH